MTSALRGRVPLLHPPEDGISARSTVPLLVKCSENVNERFMGRSDCELSFESHSEVLSFHGAPALLPSDAIVLTIGVLFGKVCAIF